MRHHIHRAALTGVGLGLIVALSSVLPARAQRQGAAPVPTPQVLMRQVTTLDGRGRVQHVFKAGETIRLRIEWTVRNAPPRTTQTTSWSVTYAGKEILLVSKSDAAHNGNWSRITNVTVARTPHPGPHIFWGRVTIEHTTAVQAITFTVHP